MSIIYIRTALQLVRRAQLILQYLPDLVILRTISRRIYSYSKLQSLDKCKYRTYRLLQQALNIIYSYFIVLNCYDSLYCINNATQLYISSRARYIARTFGIIVSGSWLDLQLELRINQSFTLRIGSCRFYSSSSIQKGINQYIEIGRSLTLYSGACCNRQQRLKQLLYAIKIYT